MPRNRIQWSEQEQMMAGAYANIASSFSQITAYMKNHLRTVQNGGGVINEGDMEDILQQLSDIINKNLHNASQMRVKITTENVAPKKITTKNTNSNWVSTASNGSPVQFESKQPQKIRISESELKQIITESVKKILKEDSLNPYGNGYGFNSFQVEGIARDKFFKLKGFDGYNEAKSIANDPNDDRLTLEQFKGMVDEWLKIAEKHNERSENNYTTHIQGDKFKVVPDYNREAEEKRFKDYTKDEYERRARKKRIGTWREKEGDRWEEFYDKPQKQPWR